MKFRQLESAVFDALGYFLLECLVGGILLVFSSFKRWGTLLFITCVLKLGLWIYNLLYAMLYSYDDWSLIYLLRFGVICFVEDLWHNF